MPADPRTKRHVIGRNLISAGYSRVTITLLWSGTHRRKQFCFLKRFFVLFESRSRNHAQSALRYTALVAGSQRFSRTFRENFNSFK